MKKNRNNNINIIPLSGVEAIGANSTLIEYDNRIVIIDAGLGFPDDDAYGVDYLIPNLDYLKKNKSRIEGIVITHGHLDHIGALAHYLEDLNFPAVYASRFALELIKGRLQEKNILKQAKLQEINRDSELRMGKMKVSFFGVNHSIPEAMGVVIKTKEGNIVHTGDFKFDNSPVNEPVAEYGKLAEIGQEGVLALLSDSTNAFKEGHSISESQIAEILEEVCEDAKGRIIVATFSSLVTRLYQLIEIAQRLNRKIYISGRSMENAIDIARTTGFIKVPDSLFVKSNQVKKVNDDRLMILATGAQGENMAALSRMSRGEHRDIKIKRGDSVILSASVIPGNDLQVQTMIDDLSKKGARVFHKDIMDLHSSGHGFKEDQKLMINLTQPKYFIPVHGYQSFLFEHAQTAQGLGIKPENTILAENGDVIEVNQKGWRKEKKVRNTHLLVSGLGVGDIGTSVLSDREQLANYGIVVIILVVDKKTKELLLSPDVVSRGFVYIRFNKDLINLVKDKTKKIYSSRIKESKDLNNIKNEIVSKVRKSLYKELEREPMIMVSVQEV